STTLELLSRTRDESIARKTRAALEDPEKWLFLDTETTGLAGGTGTYAFLIGLAWWDAGGLQAEQFFMRDFAEEHALLHELSQRVAERPVLVTFNGKSFDWPLLENRFTMTRSIAVERAIGRTRRARRPWKSGCRRNFARRRAAISRRWPSGAASTRAPQRSGWKSWPMGTTEFTPANNWPFTTNVMPRTFPARQNLRNWHSQNSGASGAFQAIP